MTMRIVFLMKESPGCQMDRSDPAPGGECGLLSAKGGLMMGTKKVGTFSSPRKKAKHSIARKKSKCKKNFQLNFFCRKYKNSFLTLSEIFYMT